MEFILKLIVTPLVLILSAKYMGTVHIKNTKAAIYTSLCILIAGFLIGGIITLLLNVLTLGIFWLVGLGIVTRTIAYSIVIEIIDRFRKDFDTKGFGPSVVLSLLLAIAWAIVDWAV